MKGSLCNLKFEKGRLSVGDVAGCASKAENSSIVQGKTKEFCRKSSKETLSRLKLISDADTRDVNANSTTFTKVGSGPTRPLIDSLSKAGQFAYCGFLADALNLLFTDTLQNKEFAAAVLDRFLRRFAIPQSTKDVMKMTLEGDVDPGGWRNYVEIMKEETSLSRNFVLLVQDLVTFAVQEGIYDARMRVLVSHCSCLVRVSSDLVEMFEESVLEYLTDPQICVSPTEKENEKRQIRNNKLKRYAAISLATVSGGALLGLTGGLAAPLIGAGLGTFIGAGGAAALASTTGMTVLGSLFGAAGAGLTGYKMKKRVEEVEEFSFDFLTQGSSLHLTIVVSGWLRDDKREAFIKPWKGLYNSREQYYLRYESKHLVELGQAMDLILQFAFSVAVQESLKYTILAGVISAITWPASFLTLASMIDNPWGICIRRSAEAGRHLAQVLLQGHHGRRPVTLIGFSLGARVIYYCLQELAERKNSAGIIQDAILLGAPVPGYSSDWCKFEGVVCGRIINGYCQTDWLLRFLYRTSSARMQIAGLCPIDWKDRRMFNFDLSDIVNGHSDYEEKLTLILKLLGIRTRSTYEIENDDFLLKKSSSAYPCLSKNSTVPGVSRFGRSVSESELQSLRKNSNVCQDSVKTELKKCKKSKRFKTLQRAQSLRQDNR